MSYEMLKCFLESEGDEIGLEHMAGKGGGWVGAWRATLAGLVRGSVALV